MTWFKLNIVNIYLLIFKLMGGDIQGRDGLHQNPDVQTELRPRLGSCVNVCVCTSTLCSSWFRYVGLLCMKLISPPITRHVQRDGGMEMTWAPAPSLHDAQIFLSRCVFFFSFFFLLCVWKAALKGTSQLSDVPHKCEHFNNSCLINLSILIIINKK